MKLGFSEWIFNWVELAPPLNILEFGVDVAILQKEPEGFLEENTSTLIPFRNEKLKKPVGLKWDSLSQHLLMSKDPRKGTHSEDESRKDWTSVLNRAQRGEDDSQGWLWGPQREPWTSWEVWGISRFIYLQK